jgi:hypothetical protein
MRVLGQIASNPTVKLLRIFFLVLFFIDLPMGVPFAYFYQGQLMVKRATLPMFASCFNQLLRFC